ncbi:tetratricopeptide repeat protein [Aureimonas leprariae]|uniref:Sel1 repeat family protein n=1 Tax=Plantimonas leprariae TaxID=2615207 RepID=A0A7V7PK39_9HYPH|nr:tetratricopeptide repeat protein [Aureimonas leprariae]KAB0675831.1 sel1 repeat family protein [Aureimonas leprariae]
MRVVWGAAVLCLTLAGSAGARPAEITWDWYRNAETYLRYAHPDPAMATKYFRLAAEAGNDAAQYKLGEHYLNGIGVAADPVQACAWFDKAASAGNRYAAVKLGECFQKGVGLARDPVAAVKWYEVAIAKGNPYGSHMLGMMLADGDGVPKDEKRARDCLELSVRETGDPWAKWRLARLIGPREPDRARRLFAEAAAQGNIESWLALNPD